MLEIACAKNSSPSTNTPDGIQIHPTEPHSPPPHSTHSKIPANHAITLDSRREIPKA
ncbi:hypothetical protein [Alkalinema sp. FACHB-956]|uniref:hypothetical protein n=1 Tax=Alkalinema sp. FACHB-956 TaxID=2692768 RepID=UPI001689C0D0|nr:hypothetical protein [Alkalinema sp. FACHB-956]MBD2325663.1 hypothetical protein [Alkalinema sp. FACHB-956]